MYYFNPIKKTNRCFAIFPYLQIMFCVFENIRNINLAFLIIKKQCFVFLKEFLIKKSFQQVQESRAN